MRSDPIDITVCLCTHNPRPDWVRQVLAALAAQSLDQRRWELLIIDNRSEPPLADLVDISGFSNAGITSEPRLGLGPARMRAADGNARQFVSHVSGSGPSASASAPAFLRLIVSCATLNGGTRIRTMACGATSVG